MKKTPYVAESTAKRMCNKVFAEAMTSWETAVRNSQFSKAIQDEILAKTKLTADCITWRKMGFRAAGATIGNIQKKAGKVVGRKVNIEMNINYLYSKDAKAFVNNTTRHELAHALAFLYDGSLDHKKTWKFVAKILGDDAERCHDYAAPENKPEKKVATDNKIKHICPCCNRVMMLTPLMAKRIKEGNHTCKCGCNAKHLKPIA
jgi:predicted SprT family Zn-dependent metalloprotease